MVMQRRFQQLQNDLEDSKWGVSRAATGEFLVSDNFSYGRVLPVSPTLCLFSSTENGILPEGQVAWLNREAISNSKEYYFARDLFNCPV
jgi:hypothetical protein